jgi:hypothetical protein
MRENVVMAGASLVVLIIFYFIDKDLKQRAGSNASKKT